MLKAYSESRRKRATCKVMFEKDEVLKLVSTWRERPQEFRPDSRPLASCLPDAFLPPAPWREKNSESRTVHRPHF